MRVPAIIEWRGGTVGWWGSARLKSGKHVTVTSGNSPTVIRRRLTKALADEGIDDPELVEDVRIPQVLLDEVEALKEFRRRADSATDEFVQERLRVARRLLNEINLTERETAALLGIVQSHLSSQLQRYTTETGEYEREPAPKPKKAE